MTLLADVVAVSEHVASTNSRSAKIALLAELLRGLDEVAVPIAGGLLSGMQRQGRVGGGYCTAPPRPNRASSGDSSPVN